MLTDCAWPKSLASVSLVVITTCIAILALPGCERKERVLDIQTPGADVQVDRNIDTGEVEVDVNED